MSNFSLVLPVSIDEMLKYREDIINSWKVASEAIMGIQKTFSKIRGGLPFLDPQKPVKEGFCEPYNQRGDLFRDYPHELEKQEHALDYSLWVYLINSVGIFAVMTSKQKNDFLEGIRQVGLKFCREEITSLEMSLAQLFQESSFKTVENVYKSLIATTYNGTGLDKKDNLRKIEPIFRIRWTNFVYGDKYAARDGSNRFSWNDLIIACRLVEGKPIPTYADNFYSLVNSKRERDDIVDCGYFVLQTYINGNTKCKWKEEYLHILDKLNVIGSGNSNTVPDSLRKRYKGEHFEGMETQDDEFKRVFNYHDLPYEDRVTDDKDFNFFETPDKVVDRMVELVDFDMLKNVYEPRCLEPSAGKGNIVRKIPEFIRCDMIEYNHHRVEYLEEHFKDRGDISEEEFLGFHNFSWRNPRNYDRVLMNPPYHNRIEVFHVLKGFNYLKPRGILCAVIPSSWLVREDRKSVLFRDFLKKYQYKEPEIVESGTFKKTQIETCIVTLIKPLI